MHHQRRAQPDHPLYLRRPARHRAEHLARLNKTPVRMHTRDPSILDFNVSDAGLLVDFNALAVRSTRIRPTPLRRGGQWPPAGW